jgi:zinc protease
MRRFPLTAAFGLVLILNALPPVQAMDVPQWDIPVQVKKLSNGLTVVASEDHSTPTFGITVVYKVGFRLEPKGRTGFAHLFEHMMFQGTPDVAKGVFSRVIQSGGGIENGSTRYDYTDYIASAPVSALETTLWLEADRMRDLDFSQENLANQQQVVKEEIRVNVKNQPYGGLAWISPGQLIFDKWENAHDGYGSFADLEAARLDDVREFHRTYYAPNNAVVALAGDFKAEEVFALAEKYFGSIPAQTPPPDPDLTESLNAAERLRTESDPFARVPGFVVGWKVPDAQSPDMWPLAVLGDLLCAGEASRLNQELVKGQELLLSVNGGLGWPLTDVLRVNGPTALIVFGLYKPDTDAKTVMEAIQREADKIAREGIPPEELERTRTKMFSDHFAGMERMIDRANLLGIRQALSGNAASINDVPKNLNSITVEDVKRVAGKYLTTANRSTIDRRPVASTDKSAD